MGEYHVSGMSCAACVARVEKAVRSVPGVTDCQVNLLTGSLRTEGNEDPEQILRAVSSAGYRAAPETEKSAREALRDDETPRLLKRLVLSVALLLPLMYLSMGSMLFGWPVPSFLKGNPFRTGIVQGLLALAVILVNRQFFLNGARGLFHLSPNMDTLVALGSGISFVYSALVLPLSLRTGREPTLYFESAAMILTLITVGKTLEARSKGRTTDALRGLIALAPPQARVIRDGQECLILADELQPGDEFIVRAGEKIPADGLILDGTAAVNEAMLTGESMPTDKESGDEIFCGTMSESGFLRCRATRTGSGTTLQDIVRMVREASAGKAPIARLADRAAGIFVPVVMGIAAVTALIWLLTGNSIDTALTHAVAVLVISCPCAMGLATPVSIMVSTGLGARNGILFKTAAAVEAAGRTEIVVLDKTGTVTDGRPEVQEITSCRDRVLLENVAYSLERESEHPLAKAIRAAFEQACDKAPVLSNYETLPGNGIRGTIDGMPATAGNLRFTESVLKLSDEERKESERIAGEGRTPLLFTLNGKLIGTVAVSDTVRPDSVEAIRQMKQMGLRVVMLTGDQEKTARSVAEKAGIREVIAGVLPAEKAIHVSALRREGRVLMAGDGINDAPALKTADVSAAIGAGSDVAVDAADIVLMNDSLTDAAAAVRLGRATLGNIRENLFWAFFYNLLLIPLAAGVLTPLTGWTMSPMLSALCMSLSNFCVVSNALRLNRLRIRDSSGDRKTVAKKGKNVPDEEILIDMRVDGMMCPHCEATVRSALEALPGVRIAAADHVTGRVTVLTTKEMELSRLKEAVEACDYTVTEVTPT